MEELMEALGEVIVWRNVLENLWGKKNCNPYVEQDAVSNLGKAKSDFAAALEAYVNARIKEAVAAELNACAGYAKSVSMPDIACIFRRQYSP